MGGMSEAEEILARARRREDLRERVSRPIDYARMNRVWPQQQRKLRRIQKIDDKADRRDKMLVLCAEVVKEWDEIGAWPDDWSLFQRALDDTFPVFQAPRLEDLR